MNNTVNEWNSIVNKKQKPNFVKKSVLKMDNPVKEWNTIVSKPLKPIYEKKPILKIEMMEEGKIYFISHIKRVNTLYGPSILVDLIDQIAFLPQEFNMISQTMMDNIKMGSFGLRRTSDTLDLVQLEEKIL